MPFSPSFVSEPEASALFSFSSPTHRLAHTHTTTEIQIQTIQTHSIIWDRLPMDFPADQVSTTDDDDQLALVAVYGDEERGDTPGSAHLGSVPALVNDEADSVDEVDPVVTDLTVIDGVTMPKPKLIEQSKLEDEAQSITVDIPLSTLVHPRSLAINFTPPLEPVRERFALSRLLRDAAPSSDGYMELDLEDFCAYIDNGFYGRELRSLHCVGAKRAHSSMYFDGILSNGKERYYVRKVPFQELPIAGYGLSEATVGDQIWIRSERNKRQPIYYRLKTPSVEYARFLPAVYWVADLGKHFIDYCEWSLERRAQVGLGNFKSNFCRWLRKNHQKAPVFQQWYEKFGHDDFRTAIVANFEFLWKEANGILGRSRAASLRVFRELEVKYYKPTPPHNLRHLPGTQVQATIVTPFIYECFASLDLSRVLEIKSTSGGGGGGSSSLLLPSMGFAAKTRESSLDELAQTPRRDWVARIKPGDVISTPPDTAKSGTKWTGLSVENTWFGLVQKVSFSRSGSRIFDVTWFYRPVDTACGAAYPWPNELFLSDHCTCDEGADCNIEEDEVLAVHSVEWFGKPDTTADIFVRQMYQKEERRWVVLKEHHLVCEHRRSNGGGGDGTIIGEEERDCEYATGDTVLAVTSPGSGIAEPFEVDNIIRKANKTTVRLRRLLRRKLVAGASSLTPQEAPPNELIYTSRFVDVKLEAIQGKCVIRVFGEHEKIPVPYDRRGTGNLFFIRYKEEAGSEGNTRYLPLSDSLDQLSLRQGFDPKAPCPKLRALDLYCGCGNFGRGLEESGVIQARWANDIWDKAIHSYMASAESPKLVHPFLGSVDDLLSRALDGQFSDSVPAPPEVDFISGGSPCPGFSKLTPDKSTLAQVKNRSLVASFASFVDFYRPKYGVLENVTNIVDGPDGAKVFAQLLCAVVGMGYQVQTMAGHSWMYGAAQSRPRVFMLFAAPDTRLPKSPKPSHATPTYSSQLLRSLGQLNNSEAFIKVDNSPTPFDFVSAGEATADLAEIGDGKPDICIPFPDHRISAGVTAKTRCRITHIPTQPYGMGFALSWLDGKGVMSKADRECYPAEGSRVKSTSKGWSRVSPKHLFGTVTTACSWSDARVGRLLHWKEQRPLTVMEARRAQGMRDEDVLVGTVSDQWRMVGNAVAAQVALAVGLAFREAWLGSLYDDGSGNRSADHGKAEANATGVHADGGDRDGDEISIIINDELLEDSDTEDADLEEPRDLGNGDRLEMVTRLRVEETTTTSTSTSTSALGETTRSATKRLRVQSISIDLVAKRPRYDELAWLTPLESGSTTAASTPPPL